MLHIDEKQTMGEKVSVHIVNTLLLGISHVSFLIKFEDVALKSSCSRRENIAGDGQIGYIQHIIHNSLFGVANFDEHV